ASGQVNPALRAALDNVVLTQKHEIAKVYAPLLLKGWELYQTLGNNPDALGKISDDLRPFAEAMVGKDSPVALTTESVTMMLMRDESNRYRDLKKKIDEFQANSSAAPPRAMVLQEKPEPHKPHVFIRGNFNRSGKAVPRQFPAVLTGEQRQ